MQPERILTEAVLQFRKLKELGDRALAQVTERDLFATLDEEANSIAILMKHLSGNMRSRWTGFLTSDGEKPDRNRDAEFVVEPGDTKDRLARSWEAAWRCVFETLEHLTSEDLGKTVWIRGEPHSVTRAIHLQLTHCSYHIGQIVLLAKHLAGSRWQSLSVPRGKSQECNTAMRRKTEPRGA